MTDVPRFRINVTDRVDEWSADNPALLMSTQSTLDTPGARFKLTVTDRADEWSADNGGLLMPIQCGVCDTPEAMLDGDAGVTKTDRADEWSPDNPALLMPTQSTTDTPGATLDARGPDA